MEGLGQESAGAEGNPFDAGFEAAPAAAAEEAVIPAAAPPADADAGFDATFGAAEPAAPASAPGSAPASGGGAALDDGMFSSGGAAEEGAPVSNGGDAAAAVFAAPTFDDPRIAWDHKNQKVLTERAQSEVKAKSEVVSKAKAFLDKQAKERSTLLDKRKKTNRELEKTSNVAAGAVPSGDKPWDRVLSVIAFNREDAKGPHVAKDTFKELSRFKGVLLAAKAANVPVGV
ncbi:MAG: hypothetical protein J3K34DRAFT_401019 [Monoraphidium minutum]|nr:MAG: hypothetical protein J3K34DRAFT_401019 [Monoraphidium minutum]